MLNSLYAKNKAKNAVLVFITTLSIWFLLSIVVTAVLSYYAPKNADLNVYFGKNWWFPAVNYGVFPISFIISCLIFKAKKIDLQLFEKQIFNYKFIPYILGFTSAVIFGLSSVNEYFIKLLNVLFGYESPNVVLPDFSVLSFSVCVIFICVLPALCEELLFRKIFVDAFDNQNDLLMALIIGGLFALFHFNPAQTLYQFIFGCVFVIVVKITKSVYATVIMHFLNNLTVLIFYYANVDFGKATLAITLVFLALFCGLIVFSIVKIAKNKKEKADKRELICLIIPYGICLIGWLVTLLSSIL